jgi:CPA2 family monovalent cation:H+ antiporter-2
MEDFGFLQELLIVFAVAGLAVYGFHRLSLPAVVGLLAAGVVVGPHGLALIHDEHLVELLAEIGVVVLLFTVGLEFSLSRVLSLWRPMLAIGLPQTLICVTVTALATRWYLDAWGPAVFAGMLVAMSSTALVLKLLIDRGELAAPHARVAVAVLLFQDLMVLVFMLALPLLVPGAKADLLGELAHLGQGLGVILAIVLGVRFLGLPMLERVVRTRNRELFLIFIFLLCVGTAVATAYAGLALALGAFLAGLVVSESEYAHQMLSEVLPFRDTLSSLFFVSVGMLLDPAHVAAHAWLVGLTVLALLVLKLLAAALPTYLFGYPPSIAARSGLALAQIGEFSFVLASKGVAAGLLGADDYQTFLAAAVVTMALTPAAIAVGPAASRVLAGYRPFPGRRIDDEAPPEGIALLRDHVLIAGFGLAGSNLARVLKGVDIPYVVLEMNPDSVHRLRGKGEPVVYGDCTRASVLDHVGIHRAKMLVLAISDGDAARRAVRVARGLNPELIIVVRTQFARDLEELVRLGANQVVPEDYVTSLELFERVLIDYQVPRNIILDLIDRVRDDQYGVFRSSRPLRLDLPIDLGRDAETQSCLIRPGSPAEGRTIEELRLRPATGATLLGIRRAGRTLVNPPADEILRAGDLAILFGYRSQIDQAIALLDPSTGRAAG